MRLWTVHPKYLDPQGLVAAWREALLAQKVLLGETKGYRNHPQLERFKAHDNPPALIAAFLTGIEREACRRGYSFDASKIRTAPFAGKIPETRGQLLCEWEHLKAKLAHRSPELFMRIRDLDTPEAHPMFRIVPGEVREWEHARP